MYKFLKLLLKKMIIHLTILRKTVKIWKEKKTGMNERKNKFNSEIIVGI